MKLSIIGTGNVGLVTGACFSAQGHEVRCVDIDAEKIERLRDLDISSSEPGLDDLVRRNAEAGRLSFTTDAAAAVAEAEVIFLCVETPQGEDGKPDLDRVLEAAGTVAANIEGFTLIVIKSTVPVGTTETIGGKIAEGTTEPFSIACNPEFLKAGSAVEDFRTPDRIVVGADDPRSLEILRELYGSFTAEGGVLLEVDSRTAELIKYASNAMLACRISFMNSLAGLCEQIGADAAELAAELPQFADIEFSALVASPNGAKRAIAAGLRSIEYVVSAADGHSRANVGRSSAEATAQIPEIVAIAHDSDVTVEVIIATAWDCPFDGPTSPQRVLDVVSAAVDAGAGRLAIADTIGTATPRRVADLIDRLRPRIAAVPLGAHFHNTRGAGLASAYAAVTRLDASIGGLGGCPFAPGASGNIATEDLVYLLRDSGVHVDVDLEAAIAAAQVAQRAVGHDLPSALLRAGDRIRD